MNIILNKIVNIIVCGQLPAARAPPGLGRRGRGMTRPWRPGLRWKRSSDHRLYRGGKERERDILAQTVMFISFYEASLFSGKEAAHSRPCNNINAGLILGRERGDWGYFLFSGGKGVSEEGNPPLPLSPYIRYT